MVAGIFEKLVTKEFNYSIENEKIRYTGEAYPCCLVYF